MTTQTKAKHTPGPWHRNIKPAGKYRVIFTGRNTHIAMLDCPLSEQLEAQ